MNDKELLEKILAPIGEEAGWYMYEITNNFILTSKDKPPAGIEECLLSEDEQSTHMFHDRHTCYNSWDIEGLLKAQLHSLKLAAYINSKVEAGIKNDRIKLVDRLAKLYPDNSLAVAIVCDEALDRSGALLGEVRDKAALKQEG